MNKQTNSEAVMRDALKMAIEAMQTCDLETGTWSAVDIALAIHACKEALASNCEALEQPAQEGISKMETTTQEPYCWLGYGMQAYDEKPFEGATPLYKHPAPTIKESLKVEPAQEPVAWYGTGDMHFWKRNLENDKDATLKVTNRPKAHNGNWKPLYTHPAPLREPLSSRKLDNLWDEVGNGRYASDDDIARYGRAIEKAHGIGVK